MSLVPTCPVDQKPCLTCGTVCAKQTKRRCVDRLQDELADARAQITALEAERDQWKKDFRILAANAIKVLADKGILVP